jgi:ADP-ribose pyrophosphatase YjhB (NUDIX family)
MRVRVAALVFREDSILLVIHQKGERRYHLLPGGGVEPGESEQAALIREVLEETGLTVAPERLVFTTESVSPDKSRHIQQRVYLCGARGEIGQSGDARVAGARFVDREKFKTLTFYPNIKREILEGWDTGFSEPPVHVHVPWED